MKPSPTSRSSPSHGRPAVREKTRGIPDRVIHYQYRADRARRTLRGIAEQVAKAQKAVDGKAPVKRNRFITVTGEKGDRPRAGGQGPRAGRHQGLHHQPHRPDRSSS